MIQLEALSRKDICDIDNVGDSCNGNGNGSKDGAKQEDEQLFSSKWRTYRERIESQYKKLSLVGELLQ